jgi:NosR/NirI family transcriptional regulator, nitrous oxide reductase regulator
MTTLLSRYGRWLHLRWPAGTVEKLPLVEPDGSTNVPGLYVTGDLTGIPLLKFSADTGARAIRTIAADPAFVKARANRPDGVQDVVIIGGGVSGYAAAIEAKQQGLKFQLLEASQPFSTVVNFPAGKPIFTYPTDMVPAGDLQFTAQVKEPLLDELKAQADRAGIVPKLLRADYVLRQGNLLQVTIANGVPMKALRVVVAIGRSGNFRKLGVPGEELGKVSNRLHDPKDHQGRQVLVVGGGDSAIEAAIAIAQCGGNVTLSYRKGELSRPKPENVDKLAELQRDPMAEVGVESPTSERVGTSSGMFLEEHRRAGRIQMRLATQVQSITASTVTLQDSAGKPEVLPNDAVFTMIGREAPLEFFRKSGVRIRGEWNRATWTSLAVVMLLSFFVYHWKKGGTPFRINELFAGKGWFPFNMEAAWTGLGGVFADRTTLIGTLRFSVGDPGFYYSLAYCVCVTLFGIQRIRRRRTPYVRLQTLTLMAIQIVPLFLLPYLLLPWLGSNGAFDSGSMAAFANEFFPVVDYGSGREYWRAFGFVLAWPLFFGNVFTAQPMWGWLALSLIQTFVLIPLIVWKWGKGAYCGWICSCGALAETLGDTHRQKMPHGPRANRWNFVGQVFLGLALLLFVLRSLAWAWPGGIFGRLFDGIYHGLPLLNYEWFVDVLWAGILGVGFYWHLSGRVWCRFACPLAALMHIYARFSKFRIFAEKKKCISCNVCTSVCHMGIDVMNFANKGLPMQDPQCVRCSACVQSCPTGVLSFGEVGADGKPILDLLAASPVQMREQADKLAPH